MKVFRKIILVTLIIVFVFSFAQTSLATTNPTLVTRGIVNLRSAPSTDSDNVVGTIAEGVSVEVLVHDPTGWSRVRAIGTTGYIRSDLLTIPAGGRARTTGGVNVRAAASTESNILKVINADVSIEVLEHDPVGWSRVRVDGVTGFIRSDFISRTSQSDLPGTPAANTATESTPAAATAPAAAQPAAQATASAAATGGQLRTFGSINMRSGPSTNHDIIRTLPSGTAVTRVSETGDWTRVDADGTVGYIRSDLLRPPVELLEWSEVRQIMRNGVPIHVFDVRTGITFYIQSFSIGDHADVEPITVADTEAKLRSRDGTWSWNPRPVWVTIAGRTIAASLAGMPHDVSTIPYSVNGVNGHFCLHFRGSTTTSTSQWYREHLQLAVTEAWEARNR